MTIQTDIIIFGGGIAGLWLLDKLRSAGYHVLLLEAGSLGQGQSIASQGIIHGGMKYTLGGALTPAAEAIADMPRQWRLCLAGKGDVDLRGTGQLSDACYMWPRSDFRSRFNAFLGSKLVQGQAEPVAREQYPAFLQGHVRGPLYRLQDLVVDVPSLLATLAQRHRDYIHQIDWQGEQLELAADGSITALHLRDGRRLAASRYISTSGEGAAFFLERMQGSSPAAMQKRPLQMVIVKHDCSDRLYMHCISGQTGTTPALTITSHPCQDGRLAWYLGGELAESGTARSPDEQISVTRGLLRSLFPWHDFDSAVFRCHTVNRAEARQPDGKRPDHATVLQVHNMLYCWPTKLTLAPDLGKRVLDTLQAQGLVPSQGKPQPLEGMEHPPIAATPWDASP